MTPPAHHQLESRRLADLYDFALDQLPVAPARVLEVGCGDGRLARALAAAGHDVTAVDPRAPEGAIFRRFAFEKFSDPGRLRGGCCQRLAAPHRRPSGRTRG